MLVQETHLNYIQNVDFMEVRPLMVDIAEGKRPVEDLVDFLSRVTSDQWSTEAGEVSLKGAELVYFGMNKRSFPTMPTFNEVMIIKLSDEHTIKFAGKKLYLMVGRK